MLSARDGVGLFSPPVVEPSKEPLGHSHLEDFIILLGQPDLRRAARNDAASPAGSSGDGRWAGRGRQIMLVVLSADDETAGIADIVYAQGGPTEHSYNVAPPVFVRRLARLQNGGLEFLAFYGWRYTFRLASDDELEGWYLAPMQAHAAAGRGLIRVHRVE
jgi:hypothetical protein